MTAEQYLESSKRRCLDCEAPCWCEVQKHWQTLPQDILVDKIFSHLPVSQQLQLTSACIMLPPVSDGRLLACDHVLRFLSQEDVGRLARTSRAIRQECGGKHLKIHEVVLFLPSEEEVEETRYGYTYIGVPRLNYEERIKSLSTSIDFKFLRKLQVRPSSSTELPATLQSSQSEAWEALRASFRRILGVFTKLEGADVIGLRAETDIICRLLECTEVVTLRDCIICIAEKGSEGSKSETRAFADWLRHLAVKPDRFSLDFGGLDWISEIM